MKCLLCRSGQLNELLLGTPHIRQGNLVHQNCLYLSSNLVQRGDEVNDICCFTLRDIKAESRRTQNLHCYYCKRTGANIGCCKINCRKTFHTYCGIKNGAQNQYTGTFKSFCNLHIDSYRERPTAQVKCAICMEQLIGERESFSFAKYIHGKCCNNGWYHRDCLQRYADSAGYFFKCPLCNDTKHFRSVALWGISVPDRDASWERTDAFADQLEVPLNCTADKCLNATGRKSKKDELFYCTLCGGNPMHPECTTFNADDYCCTDCGAVEKMSVSYLQEEEPLDPLEVYIAKQQAMLKQTSSNIVQPPSPPADLSSDSEDDFDIIIATIERKRMEATTLGIRASARSGNVTPLSTAAPSNRMHNYQALPPMDKDSSHSNVTQRHRHRFSSRGATFAARLDEKQEENQEKDLLPTSGTALKRRTRSSSRLAKMAAEGEGKENPEKEQLTPATAASSRRTRSSSRLSNIAARLEQRQLDSHKEYHEKEQLPPAAAAVNRRGRSRSRKTASSAARLKEKAVVEGDSDKENNEKQQPQSTVAVQSVAGNRLRARRITIDARLKEMQVDNDEDKPRLAAIVSRRQTCVSPSMLQKDPSPLISRGRLRKRTSGPQQNVAVDISCIAKRTRARSRK
ncbi:hypothetical protein ACLKA6_007106 [Drosophila palustris]